MILKIFRKIFRRKSEKPYGHAMEGALIDKGEDISLRIEELEKSKRETAAVAEKEKEAKPKTAPAQYAPILGAEKKPSKPGEKVGKSEWAEKAQEEIGVNLEKLKHPEQAPEKKSFLEEQAEARYGKVSMPKIKIPVSKKYRHEEPAPAEEKEEQAPVAREKEAQPTSEAQGRHPEPKKEKIKPERADKQFKEVFKAEQEPEQAEIKGRPEEVMQPSEKLQISRAEMQKKEGSEEIGSIPLEKIGKITPGFEPVPPSIAKREEKRGSLEKTEEGIEPYNAPEFVKDELMVGRLKEKREKEMEASFEKLEKQSKTREERSFLGKKAEELAGKTLSGIPVPKKAKTPVLKGSLPEEVAGSPLGKIQFQKQVGKGAEEQKPRPHIQYQEQVEKPKEIPLYEKPEIIKDDLMVGRLKDKKLVQSVKSIESDLSPIERAKTQKIGAIIGQTEGREKQGWEKEKLYEKPDFMKDELSVGVRQKGAKTAKSIASIMFGEKKEISRSELRRKLRTDPEIWKAQKEARLNLKPSERVKLEKKFFSQIYGRDISKRDLMQNLKRMGKEWASTSNIKRKETLRKEIKFLKKIGGIK